MRENESREEIIAGVLAAIGAARAQHDCPPPLTEEDLDRSETEIHNWLRRRPRDKDDDDE